MERTDVHFRWLCRQLSARALLYTEMVTVRGRVLPDLALARFEPPIALQLGGSDPALLAEATRRAVDLGYCEVNLNCGCPSTAVREGAFGARLMLDPAQVARCVEAMNQAAGAGSNPAKVTVKHRIGVDEADSYAQLLAFVDTVAAAGCAGFIVHARKAWLRGLSPKQNRSVPPLRYAWVERLKQQRPQLRIELNGGIESLQEALDHLAGPAGLDGVMVGRAIYRDVMRFAAIDARVFADPAVEVSRTQLIERLYDYTQAWVGQGGRTHDVVRHVFGLFVGMPGGRALRGRLSGYGSQLSLAQLRTALRDAGLVG